MSYQEAETNRRNEKDSPPKSQKAIQLVFNFNPYLAPEAKQIDLILGDVPNPYEVIQVVPVHSSRDGSWPQWLQTWENPGKPIAEMSANRLNTQEEKARRYNMAKVLRGRPGKPLPKGSIESYRRKDSGRITEYIASLRGKVKNDAPAYRKNRKSVYLV